MEQRHCFQTLQLAPHLNIKSFVIPETIQRGLFISLAPFLTNRNNTEAVVLAHLRSKANDRKQEDKVKTLSSDSSIGFTPKYQVSHNTGTRLTRSFYIISPFPGKQHLYLSSSCDVRDRSSQEEQATVCSNPQSLRTISNYYYFYIPT